MLLLLRPSITNYGFHNSTNFSAKKFGSFDFAKNLEDGLKSAKAESKPLMLIVHKAFCGACRVLIPKLKASGDVKKLSGNFIMVNAYNGQEPNAKLYAPDGSYVPRFVKLSLFIHNRTVSLFNKWTCFRNSRKYLAIFS